MSDVAYPVRGIFITGTDTGVGKTFVAAAFFARCRASCTDQQSGFCTYTCLPRSIAADAMTACM